MSTVQLNSPLQISDEDFLKDPNSYLPKDDEEEILDDSETDLEEEPVEEEEEELPETDESDESDDEPQGEEEETQEEEEVEGEIENEEEPEEVEDEDKKETETTGSSAEEQLAKLFAPFKANGREIKIDSVEDAITLMQMGANYTKKMTSLKPHLKMVKMLEKNGLLDEGKLNYLIDLDKRNPEAIAKLIKDSGVDPLDFDLEKGEKYKPNTYTVKDEEVALDEVLAEIRSTPTYKRTIDVVGNKWDNPSKEILMKNPQIIGIINEHMSDGTYDQISAEVDRQRMLGRLQGMSDLEAYKEVGDQMFLASSNAQEAPVQQQKRVIKPAQKSSEDPKLKDRKRAASPVKARSAGKEKEDFNPLSLPDDEFEKLLATQKFI